MAKKNIVLLNLPNDRKITRRYMCSYESQHSLFPPYELLSIGGILKVNSNYSVKLIDAIAEQLTLADVLGRLAEDEVYMLITLTGYECLTSDIEVIRQIKIQFQETLITLVGHYPTLFPEEVLRHTMADFVLHGEPDLKVQTLLKALEINQPITDAGISFLDNDLLVKSGQEERIKDVNALPIPDFALLNSDNYSEPLFPKPYGVIQSARGCPYQCNFCVKSYGTKLTEKSPQRIIDEVKMMVDILKIKSFRFTDDTFTINSKRVIEICKALIASDLSYLQWTCLSRTDNINEEVLHWMKKAGCRRIYFGVESGSPKIVQILNKKIDVEACVDALLLTKKMGIETAAFFMLGVPGETMDDVDMSIDVAIKANIDYIAIGKFTPYPGTPFFDQFRSQIDFNIYPYKLIFNDSEEDEYDKKEKYFLKKFYLRKSYLFRQLKTAIANPKESLIYFKDFLSYSFGNGSNSLGHIQQQEHYQSELQH